MSQNKSCNIYKQIDLWTTQGVPYLFIIDFEQQQPLLFKLDELKNSYNSDVQFEFPNVAHTSLSNKQILIDLKKEPISFQEYNKQFSQVVSHLKRGDSFLTNLTCETKIDTSVDLHTIYEQVSAKYKIFLKDQFVCFSPETFVKIENNCISTYPMKGTIDATINNAESLLLNDAKEAAEHATIVDLLRNDLSMVASNVNVKRYRYIDRIRTSEKDLLQVSSEIEGNLHENYKYKFGSILQQLLPAGSITGAPKVKTMEIIRNTEAHLRKYYTGVCGVFNGKNLDSCVMIRFIEQRDNQLFYKSGGGITFQSQAKEEYQEMINKVYVPRVD